MAKAPGKFYRKGLTLLEIADMFRDEKAAKEWIAEQRCPDGPRCSGCGSSNVQCGIKHRTMTHRCRDCDGKPMFSVRTGTVMERSKLKYRHWAIGIYLFATNIKGISSMKLHRELGIGQKAAWFMLHRLRKAYEFDVGPFARPVEVDETYITPILDKGVFSGRDSQITRGVIQGEVISIHLPRNPSHVAVHHLPVLLS